MHNIFCRMNLSDNASGNSYCDGPSTSSNCPVIPLEDSTQNIGYVWAVINLRLKMKYFFNKNYNFRVNTDTQVDERDKIILELQEKIKFLQQRQDVIGKLFSEEQLKKLEGVKRLKWSVEDISKAIVLYSASARAYRLLLKKGYPFPAVSSLRLWLKKIKIAPGILTSVFNFMKLSDMTSMDKICVISFDEMKIKHSYLYDKANDETLKPYSYAQVVMLRGLFKSWKQPVFYDYDFKLNKEKLFEIIHFAESSGRYLSFISYMEKYINMFLPHRYVMFVLLLQVFKWSQW